LQGGENTDVSSPTKNMSPHGLTNYGKALDGKPGTRTLNLLSNVWAAEPRTIDSRGKQ